jgi:hypothetical protein
LFRGDVENDTILTSVGRYSYNTTTDASKIKVQFNEFAGQMAIIQIADELNKAYDDIHRVIDVDAKKLTELEEQLYLDFSMFRLAKEFKTK